MYLSTDENPNCGLMEPRVFQERTNPQPVTHVLRQRNGKEEVTRYLDGADT